MLKKAINLFSIFTIIFSLSSVTSYADFFYGAYYDDHKDVYNVGECEKSYSKSDFIMKFNKKPTKNSLEKYEKSINNRLKFFKERFKDNNWPFILRGSFCSLPIIKGYERHHVISRNSLSKARKNTNYAPAILLRKNVHTKTSSYGNSKKAKEYRNKEADILKDGGIKSAFNSSIKDLDFLSAIEETSAIDSTSYSCLQGF